MKSRLIFYSILALFTCQWALGQQSGVSNIESHRYRTILTITGGGGGFAVGTFAGLAAFDDATNSDRKVWTTAALSGLGGAVAGYFIGRTLDKRPKKTTVTRMREELERHSIQFRWSPPRTPNCSRASRCASLTDGLAHERRFGLDEGRTVPSTMDLGYLISLSQLRPISRVPEGESTVDPPQPMRPREGSMGAGDSWKMTCQAKTGPRLPQVPGKPPS
jgi:hypothetical protein